jgi:hypothetical protein
MKILFVARHFTYFRNYDAALRELASRGHQIHLAVERHEALGGRKAVETLAQEWPSITFGEVPDRAGDQWTNLSRRLRLGLDYLRYLDPFYDDAPLRRVRARERTPMALVALAELPLAGGARWRRWFGRALHSLDLAIPRPAVIVDYLRDAAPDLLIITPLVDLGSQQIDYVRAARQLGIPTVLAVWSWDHLSSKALLREYPERVLVWNPTQRREALEVHGVPPDRVVVTGAQCFDHWFDRRPSRSREAFFAQLGLPADRPMILYVCTGLIKGSPAEAPFVREWLTRVRASADPVVARASVLVRPHPSQTAQWVDADLSDLGPAAIWGGNPIDQQSRDDYFDSLYHSTAVVGLNTSAFIEAGIVGREVLAILHPPFHDNQQGTVHFKYLLEIGGGLLRVSHSLGDHVDQLSTALRRPAAATHPHQAFLEAFVRPGGLDCPATPAFVQAVEEMAGMRVATAEMHDGGRWRRFIVARLAASLRYRALERLVLSRREVASAVRVRASVSVKNERREQVMAQRAVRLEARARRIAEEQRDREARIESKRRARIEKEQHRASQVGALATAKQQAVDAKRRAEEQEQRDREARLAERERRKARARVRGALKARLIQLLGAGRGRSDRANP